MKVEEIYKIYTTIEKLLDAPDIKLDTRLKFRFLTIMKNLEPVAESIDTLRDDKIREYGTRDDSGTFSINKSDTKAVEMLQKDMQELFSTDMDISIPKLDAEELFSAAIPSACLLALYSIIQESR